VAAFCQPCFEINENTIQYNKSWKTTRNKQPIISAVKYFLVKTSRQQNVYLNPGEKDHNCQRIIEDQLPVTGIVQVDKLVWVLVHLCVDVLVYNDRPINVERYAADGDGNNYQIKNTPEWLEVVQSMTLYLKKAKFMQLHHCLHFKLHSLQAFSFATTRWAKKAGHRRATC